MRVLSPPWPLVIASLPTNLVAESHKQQFLCCDWLRISFLLACLAYLFFLYRPGPFISWLPILALDNWSLLFVWCPVQISFSGLSTCVSAYILILGNSFQFVFSSNTLEIEREVLRRQRSKWLRMACSLFRKAFQRDEFRNDFWRS